MGRRLGRHDDAHRLRLPGGAEARSTMRSRPRSEEAAGAMAVDYGLHAILSGNTSFEVMEEIGDVIRGGIPTIKTMMTYGWMSDDGHRYGRDERGRRARRHERRARRGRRDRQLADRRSTSARARRTAPTSARRAARSSRRRRSAVRMLLAERTGSPLYVLHMAAGSGVEALAEGAREGPAVLRRDARGLPLAYTSGTSSWSTTRHRRACSYNNYPTIKFAGGPATCSGRRSPTTASRS